jgi:hypothetical protein
LTEVLRNGAIRGGEYLIWKGSFHMSIDFDRAMGISRSRRSCRIIRERTFIRPVIFAHRMGANLSSWSRLDGSARVLVSGQDPAQHEAIVRRILVGQAGQRAQGFLAKLGITKSYVLINTFLFSVLGQGGGNAHKSDAKIAAYRHKWLDALLVNSQIEVVVALGTLVESAWNQDKATPAGNALSITFAKITHPTFPESSGRNDKDKVKAATKTMLTNWNAGLATLFNALTQRDTPVSLVPYGDDFKDGEKPTSPTWTSLLACQRGCAAEWRGPRAPARITKKSVGQSLSKFQRS